jgi:Zn-dependent protease with chaperone function
MNTSRPSQRLNPFLFPAETDFRFLLLVAAVLGASLFLYRSLANALLRQPFEQAALGCATSLQEINLAEATSFAAKACWDPFERRQALWMAAGVLGVIGVAYLLYRLTPGWKIRRGRLLPLPGAQTAEMRHDLEAWCQEMGLRRPPRFLLDALNPTVGGLAFGAGGRSYVALSGGLVACYAQDRALFRAVVLHELAHLRNADVNKTYFSMAIWHAFVWSALLPFALGLAAEIARFGRSELGLALSVSWRAGLLALLVYALRNSILRVREFYADLAAAQTGGGTHTALRRVLDGLPPPRWSALGPLHPSPAQRRQMLDDPQPLFRLGVGEVGGAGLAIGVAVYNIVFWWSLVLPAPLELAAYRLAFAPLAPLVVGVAALGVWRGCFAAGMGSRFPQRLGRVSLGLGLGLAAGRSLSFHAAVGGAASAESGPSLPALFSALLWGAILIALLYAFLAWVRLGASVWLPTVTSRQGLRRLYRVSFALYALLLMWWLGGLLLAAEISGSLASAAPGAIFWVVQAFVRRVMLGAPFGLAALALAALFPLLGWYMGRRMRRRRHAVDAAAWVYQDLAAEMTAAAEPLLCVTASSPPS